MSELSDELGKLEQISSCLKTGLLAVFAEKTWNYQKKLGQANPAGIAAQAILILTLSKTLC